MQIIKRNGSTVDFDKEKIIIAILKANKTVIWAEQIPEQMAEIIAQKIENYVRDNNLRPNVEDIQDLVVHKLMETGFHTLAINYIKYRHDKEISRQANTTDGKILSLIGLKNQEILEENSNKNPIINSTQRDYMAGEVSKDLSRRHLFAKDLMDAHDSGMIHIHDLDYAIQRMHNCDLINLEDMLQNGTVISGVKIDTPHSFHSACNIASQVVAQVASSQYGGQTLTLSHLAPFVDVSRQKFRRDIIDELDEAIKNDEISLVKDSKTYWSLVNRNVEKRVKEEIAKGIQTFQYQLLTLMTTNGQSPFVSVFMYLGEIKDDATKDDLALIIEEVLKQRIKGVKNKAGVWSAPSFPKLLYVLEEDNIHEDGKYWYLTKLAAECTSKRLVPDYISEKIMKEIKVDDKGHGHVFGPMGCRSFLNIYPKDPNKFYGRFNQGVCTVNLIDIACSSNKDFDKFWKIFDERMELAHRVLRTRHEHLLGTPSDVAPILWQDGALARLKPGETIDKLLYDDYSTISLGYAGLWETVYYMTGKEMTEPDAKKFGLKVMEKMNEYTQKWHDAENIGYGIYGTPLESTTYKFAKCLQKKFGIIPHVTDKKYITNSYHVNVTKNIDAFSKLKFESEFQKLSSSGAISYVEIPDLKTNLNAVIAIIKFIYNNIMYAELNTKVDYCLKCGYNGEIPLKEHEGVWGFECPNCGNKEKKFMDITRRTCGYIGKNDWNQGRLEEIAERVVHVGNGTDYK